MDVDGYPTEDELATVREWPYTSGFTGLMEYLQDRWLYPDYFTTVGGGKYSVSTGGWSGHEELIGAMQANLMFWSLCWEESRRGGHYKFEIPAVAA